MGIVFLACAVVVTGAFIFLVVYLIDALKQIKRSAYALEQLLLHTDEAAVFFNQSAKTVSTFALGSNGLWGKVFNFALGLLWTLKGKSPKAQAEQQGVAGE